MMSPTMSAPVGRRLALFATLAGCAIVAGVVMTRPRSVAARELLIPVTAGPSLLPAAVVAQRGWTEGERRRADVALYERRVSEDPRSASDWSMLAAHQLQAARDAQDAALYRAAEQAARRSIALRTARNAKTMMLLSSALLAQHRFPEALAWADSMVAGDSSVVSFRALRFELQVEMGQYAAAETTMRTLLLDRQHPAVAPRLARWFELRGQPDSARRLLLAAREVADSATTMPSEQRAWFHLRVADFALRHGALDLAEEALRRGRAVAPQDLRLRQAAVRWHGLRGDVAATRALADSIGEQLDIATSSFMAAFSRAHDDPVSADRWVDRVEALNRASPEPFARGWTMTRLEARVDPVATRALLEREARVRTDVYGWDQLALARLVTGDARGAAEASSRALALGTRDGNLFWHAAQVAVMRGDTTQAMQLARTALKINPHFHVADAAAARAFVTAAR
jgi:tetratricopeptide (TPR) repeat protein